MEIRHVCEEDYHHVLAVLNDWWGGRQMTHLLPRLFFEHFQPTSFVIEEDHQLKAFLIGFISQTNPDEGYIHFIGVHPESRKKGYARKLYELFFVTIKKLGCKKVTCITSPVNEGSVAFHKSMGFFVSLSKDYAGEGQDRILFSKTV